jgi:hypothetical protein
MRRPGRVNRNPIFWSGQPVKAGADQREASQLARLFILRKGFDFAFPFGPPLAPASIRTVYGSSDPVHIGFLI